MPNQSYSIPGTRPTRSQLAAAAFHAVKEIERTVDSYRDTSLIIAKSKGSIRQKLSRLFAASASRPLTSLDQLIEQESFQGGMLFEGTNNRFWLHKRRDDSTSQWFRDWFFVHTEKDKQVRIHYETTDYGLYKLLDGVEYPLSIAEIERFMTAVERYREQVLTSLYPLDKTIDELVHDSSAALTA